jgi:hypothetical protein
MLYVSTSILARVIGVIRLDSPTIRSITRDPRGTWQAAAVVSVVTFAVALGSVDAAPPAPLLLLIAGLAVWSVRSGHAAGALQHLDRDNRHIGTARFARGRMRHIRAHSPLAAIPAWVRIAAVMIAFHVLFFWLLGGFLLPVLAWLIFSCVAFYAGAHLFGEPTTRAEFLPILRLAGFALAPGVLAIFNLVPLFGDIAMLVAVVWGLVAVTFAIRQTMMFGTVRAVLTAVTSALVTLVSCGLLVAIFG